MEGDRGFTVHFTEPTQLKSFNFETTWRWYLRGCAYRDIALLVDGKEVSRTPKTFKAGLTINMLEEKFLLKKGDPIIGENFSVKWMWDGENSYNNHRYAIVTSIDVEYLDLRESERITNWEDAAVENWKYISAMASPDDLSCFFDQLLPQLRSSPAFYELLLLLPETSEKANLFISTFCKLVKTQNIELGKLNDLNELIKTRLAIACSAKADVKTFNNSRYKWCNGRLPEPTITERYQNWWKYYEDGKTPQNFTNLTAWHLTMVVSSFWGGDCWNYAREALTEKVFKKTDVGDFDNARFNQYYFPYTLWKDTEKYGRVSVHSNNKFYEDKTMTLKFICEEGYGVCGMVSNTASLVAQCYGVPSTCIGQPGHCAFIYAKPVGNSWQWKIGNNVGGLATGCKGENPFKDLTTHVWPMYAFDDCANDPYNYVKTLMAIRAHNQEEDVMKKNALMAVNKSNWNVYGWKKLSESAVTFDDLSHLYEISDDRELTQADLNISAKNGHRSSDGNNIAQIQFQNGEITAEQRDKKWKHPGPLAALVERKVCYECPEDNDEITLDFEGSANVKRIEIQWLKDAMPKRVYFLVNQKIMATSTLDDSRVGMKNMWQSFDVGVKNCSKLVMRLTEPTSDTCETGGTYFSGEDGNSGWKSSTGIKIKFGIRRIKIIGSIIPDDVVSALCLGFFQNCVEKSPNNDARFIASEFMAKNIFDLAADAENPTLDFSQLEDDDQPKDGEESTDSEAED